MAGQAKIYTVHRELEIAFYILHQTAHFVYNVMHSCTSIFGPAMCLTCACLVHVQSDCVCDWVPPSLCNLANANHPPVVYPVLDI